MLRTLSIVVVVSLFLGIAGCAVYSERVLGNRVHNVPCEKLPTRAEAEAILRAHHSAVERIKRVPQDGSVGVMLSEPCPGRAELIIYFPTLDVRREIESLIDGETFYGIPYRLLNV